MCGIVGIAGVMPVNQSIYDALTVLQHRGQDAAGIITIDANNCFRLRKANGLVSDVFEARHMQRMQGNMGIGHVRYPTAGSSSASEAQPFYVNSPYGITLAHNGNLTNAHELRKKLFEEKRRHINTTSDSEILLNIFASELDNFRHYPLEADNIFAAIAATNRLIRGAYACVAMIIGHGMVAFRDPNGIRPLCIGELPDGRGWAVSSETCGLDIVGAQYVRDVEPGEIVRFNRDGMYAEQGVPARASAACIFEYVYFARPDSVIDGQSVYQARRNMGRILAQEAPVEADLVLGVPDSGVPPALGFAAESGIPYADGIVKNRYVGRTFIEPTQAMRQLGIRLKLNPLRSVIEGKRLVVIDDSIVRGNTSKKLVQMLRDAGATEVHLRIVSPEVRWPCFYGIDTDTRDQLIAANMDLGEMNAWIGSDSLAFISLEGLRASVPDARRQGFCDACFTGDYPVAIPDSVAKKSLLTKKDFEETYGEGAADEARPRTR